MAEVIQHDAQIVRRSAGPLGYTHAFLCSCGAASPAAHSRDVALIAKRAHLRELNLTEAGSDE